MLALVLTSATLFRRYGASYPLATCRPLGRVRLVEVKLVSASWGFDEAIEGVAGNLRYSRLMLGEVLDESGTFGSVLSLSSLSNVGSFQGIALLSSPARRGSLCAGCQALSEVLSGNCLAGQDAEGISALGVKAWSVSRALDDAELIIAGRNGVETVGSASAGLAREHRGSVAFGRKCDGPAREIDAEGRSKANLAGVYDQASADRGGAGLPKAKRRDRLTQLNRHRIARRQRRC